VRIAIATAASGANGDRKESDMKKDNSPQVDKLLVAAEKGNVEALRKVRASMPEYREYVLEKYGDLGKTTERMLIHQFTGKHYPWQDGLKQRTDHLRGELEGPNPSPLERLLVERIVCCWLYAHFTEIQTTVVADKSPEYREYYQKVSDRATRRFLAACKALAQVRKLMGPTIQVNVAEKQVNIA